MSIQTIYSRNELLLYPNKHFFMAVMRFIGVSIDWPEIFGFMFTDKKLCVDKIVEF